MAIRIVQLGSRRAPQEGVRIGTVRRPPRGVPKSEFGKQNWYDVWYPNLAPSDTTFKLGRNAVTDRDWTRFVRKYSGEMNTPSIGRTLDVLAALSRHSNFSIGCYCDNEARCHRSVLRALLKKRGAYLA